MSQFDHARKLVPNSAESWWLKVVTLRKLGKDENAMICVEKAIKINEDDPEAWYKYGVMLEEVEEKWDDTHSMPILGHI